MEQVRGLTVAWWKLLGATDCGAQPASDPRCRLMLWRTTRAGGEAPLVFLMLNPGKAHPVHDGPTVRKCLAFATRERKGGIIIVNLCAWWAPKSDDLFRAWRDRQDIFCTEENNRAILRAAEFGPIICGWGHLAGKAPIARRVSEVLGLLRGKNLLHLGISREGHPLHPLHRSVTLNTPLSVL